MRRVHRRKNSALQGIIGERNSEPILGRVWVDLDKLASTLWKADPSRMRNESSVLAGRSAKASLRVRRMRHVVPLCVGVSLGDSRGTLLEDVECREV